MTFIFDACALIAFMNEENGEGYEAVDALIERADAFLCATAKSLSAVIVTKDREIEAAEKPENLSVLWIH